MPAVPDFDPKIAAKKLLREARSGALTTLMAGSGDPYCSLVNVASAPDARRLELQVDRAGVWLQFPRRVTSPASLKTLLKRGCSRT
jgi:sulfite reductase beta subunit-like hemoprotein